MFLCTGKTGRTVGRRSPSSGEMGDSNSTRFSAFSSYFLSLFTVMCTFLRHLILRILAVGPIPRHIAIIMDGNRRFADRSGMERSKGHILGYESLISTVENCMELGVKYVSVYAFSIENFGRPQDEVDSLMRLMEEKLNHLAKEDSLLNEHGVKVQVLGDLSLLPVNVRVAAERAMAATKEYGSFVFNLCVAYTSTAEILNSIYEVRDNMLMAAPEKIDCAPLSRNGQLGHPNNNARRRVANGLKRESEVPENEAFSLERVNGDAHKKDTPDREIWGKRNSDGALLPALGSDDYPSATRTCASADELSACRKANEGSDVLENKLEPWALSDSITVEEIERHLYTAGCPPPDILIRTSGETRLSNFLLWQCCSYSRMAFCKVLWPDFSLRHLVWIILDYQRAFPTLQKLRRLQKQMLDGLDL